MLRFPYCMKSKVCQSMKKQFKNYVLRSLERNRKIPPAINLIGHLYEYISEKRMVTKYANPSSLIVIVNINNIAIENA